MNKLNERIELENKKNNLRAETLFRIKTGQFTELYPLVENLDLTINEIEEIIACWRMTGEQDLIFLYGLVLRIRDLERIKAADQYLKHLKQEQATKLGK